MGPKGRERLLLSSSTLDHLTLRIGGRELSNFRNRSRIVYFRISDDEFQQFTELCVRYGARNMSDLVRSAIKALISHTPDGVAADIAQRLKQLEDSVERLNHTMAQNGSERQA